MQKDMTDAVVTQRDVAERCGLHQTTVSLALRRDPRISPETIDKVMSAAAAIGYDPTLNTTARRLAMRRFGHQVVNHVIALTVHPQFIHFHYYAAIFSGIVDALIPAGFAVTVTHFNDDSWSPNLDIPTIFTRGDVDALITDNPNAHVNALADRLQQTPGFANRPIIGLIYRHERFSSVTTDDRHGAYLSAAHLIALGHRHLLHLCTTTDEHQAGLQRLRWAGARQALTEAGFDPARHLHFCVVPPVWGNPLWMATEDDPYAAVIPPESGQPLVALMRARPEITAVLGFNDACAQQAWRVLNGAGFAVPDDVSIVGFDDVDPRFDDRGANILTSVRLPLVEMGRTAAELAMDHVTGRLTEKREVVLPVQLMARGSTAKAR